MAVTTELMEANKEQESKQPGKLSASKRFEEKIVAEFSGGVGNLQLSDFQRQLIQGYFIGIDRALAKAEEERLRKNKNNKDHKYDNDLPVTWANVNMSDLARDLVQMARIGLDMMQKNHLSPIPYKNNKAEKYDIVLMKGYNGIAYEAMKYALDVPTSVTVELVYSTDKFRVLKKGRDVPYDSYEFEVTEPFDRGELKGGFGYIEFGNPTKNRLVFMSRKDIEKRKPQYASANFWGGEQKIWENGKQITVETEGWYDEMCYKTLVREVYSEKNIPRDPAKIDDAYRHAKLREAEFAAIEAKAEIVENANGELIDATFRDLDEPTTSVAELPTADIGVDEDTGEVVAPEETDDEKTKNDPQMAF